MRRLGFSQWNDFDSRPDPFVDESRYLSYRLFFDVAKIESSRRTEIGAVWLQVYFDPLFAQRTLLHDATGMDKLWSIVRAGPRTVPAADAAIRIVVNRLERLVLAVSARGAMLHTQRNLTMIAGE
jgi:hypothetical protein